MHRDRLVDIVDVDHDLTFHEGGRRLSGGSITLTDAEGGVNTYTIEDMGWVYCQGGGYFGGWNDGLGQGVYRGDDYLEHEVWDVSHPTTVVGADGDSWTFEHDWAENFVRLIGPDGVGSAHYECVVIRDPESW